MGDRTAALLDARAAQRRVALLLLPLRVFMGVAWLRAGLSKLLEPSWLDGSALTGFLHGQVADGAAPFTQYTDVVGDAAARMAAPMGLAVAFGEIAIGLGLLTGTLTSLALVMAIVLNVNFVLAGAASPSQYYIVIQLVLLVGRAGSDFSLDRWVAHAPRAAAGADRRGVLAGPDAPRAALVAVAVLSAGAALAVVALGPLRLSALLPSQGVDDPTYAIVALLGTTTLLTIALLSVRHASHRDAAIASQVTSSSDSGSSPGVARPPTPRTVPERASQLAPPRAPSGVAQRRTTTAMPPRAPAAARAPSAVRSDGAPIMAAFGGHGVGAETQPTTQFARPVRGRDFDRGDVDHRTDPYAELRDLLPAGAAHEDHSRA